ncbi:hypothetical protein QE152_g39119 [Popillia japonica]|uniref:Reverse transcriptase n=1 Tax=Popillia japonica TaxID=7064 RepID=A0AAW1HUY6_POPJA
MMEEFVAIDEEENKRYHKEIRSQILKSLHTEDDRLFIREEIEEVMRNMDSGKAPGKNGITSEILLTIYTIFLLFLTEVYNQCLIKTYFPKEWKESIIVPIIKLGKKISEDVSKYHPISLINVGGKVLEKLLINRIMAYTYVRK